ncbi:MAG TPA: signal recognition particle protein, partial [Clostridiales bacterium]|nr:signal recognition particle protein [Clostridiales bacterium]
EKKFVRVEAIIKSMTLKERRDPAIINGSRRKRIAAGSGTSIQEVNSLLKQFEEMRKMIKMMTGVGKKGARGLGKFRMPF